LYQLRGRKEVDAVIQSLKMRMTDFFKSGDPEVRCWLSGKGRPRLEADINDPSTPRLYRTILV
jgi:hypothetical protein